MNIPIEEKKVTENQLFEALDYTSYPALAAVKEAVGRGDWDAAKKTLLGYFETRNNVNGFFDYRGLPLKPADLTDYPEKWQSFIGLNVDFDIYVAKAGEKMKRHIYLLPGGAEIDLGEDYNQLPHASQADAQKVQQGIHIVMKRGKMFELLAVLYQRDGDRQWVEIFNRLLRNFFDQYNLTIEEFSASSAWFQYSENRESMDVGWLLLTYINLLHTRIAYEADSDLIFEMIKRIWFLGMQFHRYDTDGFAPHNHHFFERGIVPYITAMLMPEFPQLKSMAQRGREVCLDHIERDFTESGAYAEHSIGYFFGATVSEMLFRVLYIAKAERDDFFDAKAKEKIKRIFDLACHLASPEELYPVVGDQGNIVADKMLSMGEELTGNELCRGVLKARRGEKQELPLDYCSGEAGFITGRSSHGRDANYFMLCAKQACEMSSHDHMDMLSLHLAVNGTVMFGESVAGDTYSRFIMGRPHRGFLYNMSSHNTVLAHGKPISPDSYFSNCWGVTKPATVIDLYEADGETVTVRAHHNGYGFCTVERELIFERKKGFAIKDSVILGGRDAAPHLQRWFLEKGCSYRQIGKQTWLFERENTKLLCRWQGERLEFCFSKPSVLYPDIYVSAEETPWMLDVKFHMSDDPSPENRTAVVQVWMIDVSGRTEQEIEQMARE